MAAKERERSVSESMVREEEAEAAERGDHHRWGVGRPRDLSISIAGANASSGSAFGASVPLAPPPHHQSHSYDNSRLPSRSGLKSAGSSKGNGGGGRGVDGRASAAAVMKRGSSSASGVGRPMTASQFDDYNDSPHDDYHPALHFNAESPTARRTASASTSRVRFSPTVARESPVHTGEDEGPETSTSAAMPTHNASSSSAAFHLSSLLPSARLSSGEGGRENMRHHHQQRHSDVPSPHEEKGSARAANLPASMLASVRSASGPAVRKRTRQPFVPSRLRWRRRWRPRSGSGR